MILIEKIEWVNTYKSLGTMSSHSKNSVNLIFFKLPLSFTYETERLNTLSNLPQMGVSGAKHLAQLTTTTRLWSHDFHDLILGYFFFPKSRRCTLWNVTELLLINVSILININSGSWKHRKMCEIRTIYHSRKCGLHELIKKQKEEGVSYILITVLIELELRKEVQKSHSDPKQICRQINFTCLAYVTSFD